VVWVSFYCRQLSLQFTDRVVIVSGLMILGVIGLALLLASYGTKGWALGRKETVMKAAALTITAFLLLPSSTQGQESELSPNGRSFEVIQAPANAGDLRINFFEVVHDLISNDEKRNCEITGWVGKGGIKMQVAGE
jgi:hypothetical protein